jgi:NodT family efflux transporter outer membrane factor (OMF) lipoprotein
VKHTPRFYCMMSLMAVLASGCSMMPDYIKPQTTVPDAFKEEGPWRFANPSDAMPRGEWWKGFQDPLLDSLEARLDSNSLELAQAVARHDGAEAVLAGQQATQLPEIGSIGNYTTNRQSANRPLRGSNQPNVYGTTTLQAGLSYELDLWGRVRSAVASAQAQEAASAADVQSLQLSLHAQLANTYIQLRGLDSQIQLLTESITAYERQAELISRRHQEGIVSGVDVGRAQTLLEETRSQKTQAESQRALYEHAIATLLGESASAFSIPTQALKPVFPSIPNSVPSAVLQRRPDIAAAERRVMSANAEIGLAKAAFYPTIFLGAQGGFQNTGQGNLVSTPNSFWSLGPAAFFSIFDAGRRDAVVQQASARTQEASARYKSTVLTAFKEVEDNLSLLHHLADQGEYQNKAAQSAQHTYELAMNQYREGATSYLEVIDAETTKLRTEQAKLNITVQRMQASVALVRALGGDW